MSSKTLLTADELKLMPYDDSVQTELDEWGTMPPAGGDHGGCEVAIGAALYNYARRRRLGKVYPGNTGFRLVPQTVRVPDVASLPSEHVNAIHSRGFVMGAPDLAVEIFSLSDNVRQLMRIVKQYSQAARTQFGLSILTAAKSVAGVDRNRSFVEQERSDRGPLSCFPGSPFLSPNSSSSIPESTLE